MTRAKTNILLLTGLAALYLTACYLPWDQQPYENNFTGDFHLTRWHSTDLKIVHGIGNGEVDVIPATVFALGWTDDFIIVKQHPDLQAKVKASLFYGKNPRGHNEIKNISDTIFLNKGDSVYNEYGLWYHVREDWSAPDSLNPYKGLTYYHIIDFRKEIYIEGRYKVYTFDNERDFNVQRFVLDVPKELGFKMTFPEFE